jgi:hypothetical protein
MLRFSDESINGIKKSIKSGDMQVTGTASMRDGDVAGALVAVLDSALGATYHIPLNLWIRLDENSFDYGMTSALIDSAYGYMIFIEPGEGEFIPSDDVEGLIAAGIAPDAKEYWAGYNTIFKK